MANLLQTERLILRPLAPDDAEPTARIMSPAIARWTGSWTGAETAAEVAGRIRRLEGLAASGQSFDRVMVLADTGELIGWVGVRRLAADPARGALGYWIGEAWFGRGYAKEVARAVVDAAWEALGLQAIEAAVQVANHASHRILLGLGMRRMGRREEFATARGAADLCDWYELARPGAAASGGPPAGNPHSLRR